MSNCRNSKPVIESQEGLTIAGVRKGAAGLSLDESLQYACLLPPAHDNLARACACALCWGEVSSAIAVQAAVDDSATQ